MDKKEGNHRGRRSTPERKAIEHLRKCLKEKRDWPTALLETMAVWTAPQETYRSRRYSYFIGEEAFDWLALAERLCYAVGRLIPDQEKEDLLFAGRFPHPLDDSKFKDLLGVDKYRGHLNYFYGVTVEEALQLAVEREVQKRHLSNGNRYQQDFSEEAYLRIYQTPRNTLIKMFREDKGYQSKRSMSLTEYKEFTYWLFKYRLKISDKEKVASDTRKGLKQLHQMASSSLTQVSHHVAD